MKVAIMDEWLTVYGGAARVLQDVLQCHPEADVFCIVDFFDKNHRDILQGHKITPSMIQWLPFAERRYRWYLPLMPFAVRQLDLSGYDLVISLNHACAKGVRTRPGQEHLCYVHTPMRYAWDMQEDYLHQAGLGRGPKGWLARRMLAGLRRWDYRTAQSVDHFMANSQFVAQRIGTCWNRTATVINPPVDIDSFDPVEEKDDYYLVVSRLVQYKRIDLVVEAFAAMPDKKLVVVGEGPEMPKIQALATKNVTVLGHQPFAAMRQLLQKAKAFLFAATEDFGIVLVEAQACGTPVIAYGRGGAVEIVRGEDTADPTGVLFDQQTVAGLVAAVERFERRAVPIRPQACRANALRFGRERFRREFSAFVREHAGQPAALPSERLLVKA